MIGTDYAGSLFANTTYYWRVYAHDGADGSNNWCTSRSFRIIAPFSFVHITDLHVGHDEIGGDWDQDAAKFKIMQDSILAMNPKPAFVVATGDLVHHGSDATGEAVYPYLTGCL
ncbi:MAG: metallophosphoesterase [Candidatus Edwardsbacteria bacterium]|nr:metallophosphoesterase [Candidatus Edwardsbacteria bacterium]